MGSEEDTGKFWKNGVATELGEYKYPQAISVSGSDVHIVFYYNIAVYHWKNGVAKIISDGTNEAYPWDIIVSGGDIHIVGRDGSHAAYWKNGTSVPLEDGRDAYSICMIGDDVYIAGTDTSNRAKYWKNGEPITLTEEQSGYDAAPMTIVVK